jgi:hypothetical protein
MVDPRRRVAYEACIRPAKVRGLLNKIAERRIFDKTCSVASFQKNRTEGAAVPASPAAAEKRTAAARDFLLAIVSRQRTAIERSIVTIESQLIEWDRLPERQRAQLTQSGKAPSSYSQEILVWCKQQREVLMRVLQQIGSWRGD